MSAPSIIQLTLPMFIGTILNWGLFGTLLVQVYIYYVAFPEDRAWWKAGVAAVLLLEIIETLSSARDMIHVFGGGWGNPEALDEVGWAWFSTPVMGSIVASVGQCFFAYRIHILSRSLYVPVPIIILSVGQLVAGIWTGVNICRAGKFSLLQAHNVAATATWLATTSACDLVIVFGTVFYIQRSRPREFNLRRLDTTITRVLMVTVETGVLCALTAIVDLYLFTSFKGTNYHLGLCIELSKLYANSILLIFNSRINLRHKNEATSVNLSGLSLPRSRHFRTSGAPLSSITGSTITNSKDGVEPETQKGSFTV